MIPLHKDKNPTMRKARLRGLQPVAYHTKTGQVSEWRYGWIESEDDRIIVMRFPGARSVKIAEGTDAEHASFVASCARARVAVGSDEERHIRRIGYGTLTGLEPKQTEREDHEHER